MTEQLPSLSELLTPTQAARLLGISRGHLYRLTDRDEIPYILTPRGALFRREDLSFRIEMRSRQLHALKRSGFPVEIPEGLPPPSMPDEDFAEECARRFHRRLQEVTGGATRPKNRHLRKRQAAAPQTGEPSAQDEPALKPAPTQASVGDLTAGANESQFPDEPRTTSKPGVEPAPTGGATGAAPCGISGPETGYGRRADGGSIVEYPQPGHVEPAPEGVIDQWPSAEELSSLLPGLPENLRALGPVLCLQLLRLLEAHPQAAMEFFSQPRGST